MGMKPMDETSHPNQSNFVEIDRLVHEPARLAIMALLYVIESADFTFLMNQTGLSWGNLSTHMSKMEEAGYIDV
jgi:DNA-binding transcriptional ArsR family regulator